MNDEKMVVFEKAAAMFAVLSTPIRLRIISELCQGERNVGQLLCSIDVAQPNMYRAGILGKRRQGAQMFYRIAEETAVVACRAVCTQMAIDLDVE
jgi:DNA-binding transcriptional ArsR family regulator